VKYVDRGVGIAVGYKKCEFFTLHMVAFLLNIASYTAAKILNDE
jgi:hypothetical protein